MKCATALGRVLSLALAIVLVVSTTAFASEVDIAIVDIIRPIDGSVTLAPGTSAPIRIDAVITGKQDGTSSFTVNRVWTYSGGAWHGTMPQTFAIGPRSATQPAQGFAILGQVVVAAGEAGGPKALTVPAFNITNSNAAGAKLVAGDAGSYSVVVLGDGVAPRLALPDTIVTEATGPSGANVDFSPTALDDVDGPVGVLCTPPSGSQFPLGTSTVSCSAADAAGNRATGSFNVVVIDTTAPAITLPEDLVLEASGPAGYQLSFNAFATDLVSGAVEVSCLPASGSWFPLGITEVVCSAEDAAGNTSTQSFLVTVRDTTAPILSLPDDMVAEATGPDGASVDFNVTAVDVVDESVTIVCAPPSGSTFPIGTTEVACSAADDTGNAASGAFSVTVRDTTPPALTLPDALIAEATGPAGATVDFSASAVDLVDGSVDVQYSIAPGSTFPLGETEVTVIASDSRGNATTGSFKVSVVDTTPPVLALPGAIAVKATCSQGACVDYSACAEDLVDGSCALGATHASGAMFPIGTTVVSCSACDAAGNHASGTFSVYVTYDWGSILQPINANGSSIFKLGSTVPVKFKLAGLSAEIADAPAKLYVAKTANGVAGSEIEALSTAAATTGNLFRYDATAGQYIFNLSTKGMEVGTYLLRIDLGDGEIHTVQISLRK